MVDPAVENVAMVGFVITWGSFIAVGILGKPWKISGFMALAGGFLAACVSMVVVLFVSEGIAIIREEGWIRAIAFLFVLYIVLSAIKELLFGRYRA